MRERISKSDWERIREFANTPMYERTPEMLIPEGGEEKTRENQSRADQG